MGNGSTQDISTAIKNSISFSSITSTITNNTSTAAATLDVDQTVTFGCGSGLIALLDAHPNFVCACSFDNSGTITISQTDVGSVTSSAFISSAVTDSQANQIQNAIQQAITAATTQAADALGGLATILDGPHSQTTSTTVTTAISTAVASYCTTDNISAAIAQVMASQDADFTCCAFTNSGTLTINQLTQQYVLANSLVTEIVDSVMSTSVGNDVSTAVQAAQASTATAFDFSSLLPIAIAGAALAGLAVVAVVVLKAGKGKGGASAAPPPPYGGGGYGGGYRGGYGGPPPPPAYPPAYGPPPGY